MANWKTLADENYAAAHLLVRDGRWRSALNRAYYAVYARTAGLLTAARIAMPAGREGPHHSVLPDLVAKRLVRLGAKRWSASSLVRGLYGLRVIADYRPSVTVEETDARAAVGMMMRAFQVLRETRA
jgi:uncharacterized protein (UPF0332 family)